MPNGVYGPCTADVNPRRAGSGPRSPRLLTLWLAPSFLHVQIDTWCRGRQTGGLSAPRLQRCGPAVSRLIQSNLPLSQAGTPGWSPLILTPRGTANNSALVNATNRTPGGELLASEISLHWSL